MKSREQKQKIIDDLKKRFDGASAVAVAGYKGMTVADFNELRAEVKPSGTEFTVIKNTLAAIAVKGTDYEPLLENIEGPRAAAFMGEEPGQALKAMFKLNKKIPALEILEGIIDGERMDKAQLKAYSELPTLPEMQSMLLGVFQAPMSKMAALLAAPAREIVGVLNAYEGKGGGEVNTESKAPEEQQKSDDKQEEKQDAAPEEAQSEKKESGEQVKKEKGEETPEQKD